MCKGPEVERVRPGLGYEHLCSSSSYFGRCPSPCGRAVNHTLFTLRENMWPRPANQRMLPISARYFFKDATRTVLGHSAPWESDWDKRERSIFSFVWHQHLWRWYKPKAMEAMWRNPNENEVNSEKHQAKKWWGHEIVSLQHCQISQIHPYLKPVPETLQLPPPIKFPFLAYVALKCTSTPCNRKTNIT